MSWKELPQSTHKIVIMFEIEEDVIKKLFFFFACKIKNYALFLH